MKTLSTLILVSASAVLLACGETEPQDAAEQLRQAEQEYEEAQGEIEEAQQKLEERREAYRRSRARVEAAREELEQAQAELQQTEAELLESADDTAIFRVLQSRLLDASELATSAVVAHVNDGVVTLRGSVDDADARDRALEIAKAVPGVRDVRDQLNVTDAEGA